MKLGTWIQILDQAVWANTLQKVMSLSIYDRVDWLDMVYECPTFQLKMLDCFHRLVWFGLFVLIAYQPSWIIIFSS